MADSDDHVFPQFLGGRRTVKACTDCNNRFGQEFEARVSFDIAPIAVQLALCGLKLPRRIVWKKAFKDPSTGLDYDLGSDWKAALSQPVVQRDDQGNVRTVTYRSPDEAKRAVASLKARAPQKEIRLTLQDFEFRRPTLSRAQFNIGEDLRRLAIKTCCAAALLVGWPEHVLSDAAREFLLRGGPSTAVRIALESFGELDALTPPLAHVVYVERSPKRREVYGIVQFFGAIQLYVQLGPCREGEANALIGTVDAVSGEEAFSERPPLDLPEAPQHVTKAAWDEGIGRWRSKLDVQVRQAFGENVLVWGPSGA